MLCRFTPQQSPCPKSRERGAGELVSSRRRIPSSRWRAGGRPRRIPRGAAEASAGAYRRRRARVLASERAPAMAGGEEGGCSPRRRRTGAPGSCRRRCRSLARAAAAPVAWFEESGPGGRKRKAADSREAETWTKSGRHADGAFACGSSETDSVPMLMVASTCRARA